MVAIPGQLHDGLKIRTKANFRAAQRQAMHRNQNQTQMNGVRLAFLFLSAVARCERGS